MFTIPSLNRFRDIDVMYYQVDNFLMKQKLEKMGFWGFYHKRTENRSGKKFEFKLRIKKEKKLEILS